MEYNTSMKTKHLTILVAVLVIIAFIVAIIATKVSAPTYSDTANEETAPIPPRNEEQIPSLE
jgi:hypothetical protein